MEECHQRLITGQVEAERRIVELEARVARLQDELAMGGVSGHIKLQPPAKFTRKGFPTV